MVCIDKIIHLGIIGVVGRKTPQNSKEKIFLSYEDGFNGLKIM
jgi:hypothetical protein